MLCAITMLALSAVSKGPQALTTLTERSTDTSQAGTCIGKREPLHAIHVTHGRGGGARTRARSPTPLGMGQRMRKPASAGKPKNTAVPATAVVGL